MGGEDGLLLATMTPLSLGGIGAIVSNFDFLTLCLICHVPFDGIAQIKYSNAPPDAVQRLGNSGRRKWAGQKRTMK